MLNRLKVIVEDLYNIIGPLKSDKEIEIDIKVSLEDFTSIQQKVQEFLSSQKSVPVISALKDGEVQYPNNKLKIAIPFVGLVTFYYE